MGVGYGATTYGTHIDYAGALTVWSGGVVHNNEIDQWGNIYLLDGAIANSTTINPGGGLHVYDGATAFSNEVTSGAHLGIGYGGCIYSTELDNTGTMTFYDGSIMAGWNNFEGTVTTSGGVNGLGAYVNFELDDRTADQGAILDDIGNFYSVTRYSMEVGLDQALGTYDLAGDASDFGERVTLYIGDGNDCGSLAVGEYLDYNSKRYTLENNNGTLALKVS
jgi:autotransporter passenger strand-loop-strand repeat protein